MDCGQKIQTATVDTAHVQAKCGCVEILLVDTAGLHCLRRGTIHINTRQKKGKNCFCSLPTIENHKGSNSCANCAPCQVLIPGRADAMAGEREGI